MGTESDIQVIINSFWNDVEAVQRQVKSYPVNDMGNPHQYIDELVDYADLFFDKSLIPRECLAEHVLEDEQSSGDAYNMGQLWKDLQATLDSLSKISLRTTL